MSNKSYVFWTQKDFIGILKGRQMIQLDSIIGITGNRGFGKSTDAFGLSTDLRIGFNPQKDILYNIDDLLTWYSKNKGKVVIFDEAIAIHNREFFAKTQRKLIKILNMYRDSRNILFLCIPIFENLDSQVRQLIQFRFHITERGRGVFLMPKQGIYNTADRWDSINNQKIEQHYLSRNKPVQYSKLSTFVGWFSFPKLSKKQQGIYDEIKQTKRNVIFEEDNNDSIIDPFDKVYSLLREGRLTKEGFSAICLSQGIKVDSMKKKIARKLEEEGESTKITRFFKK